MTASELKTSRQPEWNFRKKSMQMKNSAKFSRKSVEQQPGRNQSTIRSSPENCKTYHGRFRLCPQINAYENTPLLFWQKGIFQFINQYLYKFRRLFTCIQCIVIQTGQIVHKSSKNTGFINYQTDGTIMYIVKQQVAEIFIYTQMKIILKLI